MNGDKHVQGPPKGPHAKRGRKPKRTIRTFHRLVAEVEAELVELMKKNPKRKKLLVRQAIKNCLKRDTETQPHSWWWKDDVPLGLDSAKALFFEAKAAIKKQGPVEPSSYESLSELGERLKLSAQTEPSRTLEQMLEERVIHKRWLYEQKQTILPSTFLACTRECKREELKIIAGLKHVANEIHTALAKDASEQSYLGRALGVNSQVEIDHLTFRFEKGDTFVLVTDGIYEHVGDRVIARAIKDAEASAGEGPARQRCFQISSISDRGF